MPKTNPLVREKLINYFDAAVLLGLRPCPSPAPVFIETARRLQRKITLVVAFDPNLELHYFRQCNADIFQEDIDFVDVGCNVASSDTLARNSSVTTICEKYSPNFKSSKKFGEKFEVKTRLKYQKKRPDGSVKFKKMTIFRGAHDGSNDAFWTLRAFLFGVHRAASKSNELRLDAVPPWPFPAPFRIMSVDFEGGQNLARQMGLAEIDSVDLSGLPFDNWTEAVNVRSFYCEEERNFKNPFCLPDTGPQFCEHEWFETAEKFGKAIMSTFARENTSASPGHPIPQPRAIDNPSIMDESDKGKKH